MKTPMLIVPIIRSFPLIHSPCSVILIKLLPPYDSLPLFHRQKKLLPPKLPGAPAYTLVAVATTRFPRFSIWMKHLFIVPWKKRAVPICPFPYLFYGILSRRCKWMESCIVFTPTSVHSSSICCARLLPITRSSFSLHHKIGTFEESISCSYANRILDIIDGDTHYISYRHEGDCELAIVFSDRTVSA